MAVAAAAPETDIQRLEATYIAELLNGLTFGTPLGACRKSGFEYQSEHTGQFLRDPVTTAALEILEAELEERPVLVTTHPGPLLRTRPGGPWGVWSRHGALVQSPEQPAPHHCILLIGIEHGRLFHLDPYYPVEQQPFSLSREQFVYAWLGEWAYWPG